MAYDPQTERTILIGMTYKDLAKDNAADDKRTLRGYIENLIEQDTKKKHKAIKKVLTNE